MKMLRLAVPYLAIAAAAQSPLSAQAMDLSRAPAIGSPPVLRFPTVREDSLPSGLVLYVVEQHEVPVVQFTLVIQGGARQDGEAAGLATFTATMLQEGADTLDAFGVAAQAEYLGAKLSTGADWDRSYVAVKVPRRTMGRALQLLATLTLDPMFRTSEIRRQQSLRFASIRQSADEPDSVARNAFYAVLYPVGHPYHRPLGGDSAGTARLDSAVVRHFWLRSYRPSRAQLIVSGDITAVEAKKLVAHAFRNWHDAADTKHGGNQSVAAPAAGETKVYLVDKPRAAQSVIAIGQTGVERKNPDYFALQVMNTVLGGSFSSRLNQNLRETKGYTYGAFSGFTYRPVPGPFTATAAVRSEVTDSSLIQFFRELRSIRDSMVTDAELRRAKSYIALGLPRDLETPEQLAKAVQTLILFDLPLDYYEQYVTRIMSVTAEDVQRVARKYIDPEHLSVLVVGDEQKIRSGVEALRLGAIEDRGPGGEPRRSQ
jgi:predicted Zn-dependent peptidase